MKGNIIVKTVWTGIAAALLVVLFSACPMDTPENSPSFYTVSYSPGEGSGSIAPVTKREGETIRLSDGSGFTAPEGKKFDNWKDGAGNAYAAGNSYSKDEDLSLTAQWVIIFKEQEIEKTITITDLPGGHSTLAVYLSEVQDLSGNSDIAAAGGLPSGGTISASRVSYLLYRYSEEGGSPPLWTGSGSYYVYLCWDGSSMATEVSTVKIGFDEKSTTISYTGTFQAFTQKKVEVLNQSGSITAGTGGTATYQINKYNISTGAVTIKWYSDPAGTTEIPDPADISGSTPSFTTEGDHETSTITFTVNSTVSMGVYYFRALIGSYYSAVKGLTVSAPLLSFNASELNGWNVMEASAGDVDSTKVPNNSHIYDGPSSKIHYDGSTRVLTYRYNSEKRTANLASPADDEFHRLFSNIGTGNDVKIEGGKVSSLLKMAAAGWNIDFDSIQSILDGYVTLGNWAAGTNEPIEISGTFPGTKLSFQGDHSDDAFAVPDNSSLAMPDGTTLSFNSSSHLVLGVNSSLILRHDGGNTRMVGYGKVVAGQTEFSFGDSEASMWRTAGITGHVTITRTGTYTSSIAATGDAYLCAESPSATVLPVITQKQGNAGSELIIGCRIDLGVFSTKEKKGSLVLEGTSANKGLVRLIGDGIICADTIDDSQGTAGTSITGLGITGGKFALRKDSESKFLFIKPDSGASINITPPSGTSDFTLSAETTVN
ncbi:MAG: hypothetical protein LBE10_00970 [Treponema sp.]|jgi:hypothetical protein|nr:hypothetical protein [Treponema sp.]